MRDVVAHRSATGSSVRDSWPDAPPAAPCTSTGSTPPGCGSTARAPPSSWYLLRRHLTPTGLTAGPGGAIAVTDGLIHHQDIRRPLGLPRTVPQERLLPALRTALCAPVLSGVLRVRDVRLVATDVDWAFGRGPEVRGTAEALRMAIAGRPGLAAELFGPGRERVAQRLG